MPEGKLAHNKSEAVKRNQELSAILYSKEKAQTPEEKKTITERLPDELKIDPASPEVSSEQIKTYLNTLRSMWVDSEVPEKRTVAKHILMATANPNYTKEISDSYPVITEKKIESLSLLRRKWLDYNLELLVISKNFLAAVDELSDLTGLSDTDKQKIKTTAREKMFVYNSFMQMLVNYPAEKEENLELLLERSDRPDLMKKNFDDLSEAFAKSRQEVGEDEWDKRYYHFQKLVKGKLESLAHYSPHGDLDPLLGGRRVMDRLVSGLFDKYDESVVIGLINKAIKNGDEKIADQVIRYYRQDALRAVDRVNDVLMTDRFIYTLLEGQIHSAPVRNLEYIYKFDAKGLEQHGLHYYSPTHPQALHAMKMITPYEQMPEILGDTVDFFTQGMFIPEDFAEVYTNVLAASFSPEECPPEMFNFLFENMVVNEESKVSRNENGKFVADEWIVMAEEAKNDPMYERGKELLSKVNAVCKNLGVIPPLRPYAVMDKDISVKDHATVIKNPDRTPPTKVTG